MQQRADAHEKLGGVDLAVPRPVEQCEEPVEDRAVRREEAVGALERFGKVRVAQVRFPTAWQQPVVEVVALWIDWCHILRLSVVIVVVLWGS